MDKRFEQFTPDADSIRPDAPPDEGKKSAEDFAQHLAALLRAERHSLDDAGGREPLPGALSALSEPEAALTADTEAKPAVPEASEPLSSDLDKELSELLELTAEPPAPEPEAPAPDDLEQELSALLELTAEPPAPEPEAPAPDEAVPQANRSTPKPALSRGTELQPARMELTPSADESPVWEAAERSEAPQRVRSDLSNLPFAPPEEDPSLEELFPSSAAAPAEPEATADEPLPDEPEASAPEAPIEEDAELLALLARAEPEAAAEDDAELLALLARTEADEAQTPSVPLSQDTTGPLPSLEEIFGPGAGASEAPEAAEADAASLSPAASVSERPARRGKLRGLLDGLLAPQTPEEFAEAEAFAPEAAPAPATEPTPASEPETPAEPELSFESETSSEPESVPEPEAPAEPENLSEPEISSAPEPITEPEASQTPPEPSAASPERTEPDAGRRGEQPRPQKTAFVKGGASMTLEELLAAAVPIEDAAPPVRTPPQPEPEKPSAPSRKHRKRSAARAEAAAEAEKRAAVAKNEAEARMAASVSAMEAALAEEAPPARSAGADAPQAPSGRAEEKSPDPVPSADVRKPTTPPKAAERRAQSEPDNAPPPEKRTVLHPEEAYRQYAQPLDLIGARLVLTGMFTILSLFFTFYLSQHWTFLPEIFSGGTTVYIQLGLLVLMLLSNYRLFFRRRPGGRGLRPTLLLGIAALFTAADCFRAATELRSPFTVVFGVLTMIFLWGEYDHGMAMTATLKVLRADTLAAGVSEVPEIGRDGRGLIRTQPDAERFMEKLETRDLTARILRVYTPTAAVCGAALTLLIGFGLKQDLAWTGALIFLGSIPAAGLLAYPRLFLLVSRRLAEADAALCGYHGAEVFGGDHSILIGDEDLFPAGSLTLNGFKIYNSNPDRIIAYAAAAARSSASALDPVFDDLLVTHNGRHYIAETFRFYDSGGIGASIGEDVVLMGSLDFMRRMGVHMDKGAKVKQAVYLSLNGELAAVFAIRYAPPENLRKGLASIAANRHFKGILVTRTFLGTPGFLKAKFGIPAGTFLYPSTAERIRLSEAELKRTGAQGAILAKDSFSGFAQAAAAGRMLRSTSLCAAILTVLNGVSGLLLTGVLAAIPALEAATALNLLLYCVAWLAPTLLLTVWGRHF